VQLVEQTIINESDPRYAAIDRVIHHCVILDMMAVDSFRVQQAHAQHQSEEASDRQE
jgi:hypothetical protein